MCLADADRITVEGLERLSRETRATIDPKMSKFVQQLELYPIAIKLLVRCREEAMPFHLRREIDLLIEKDKEISQ